MIDQSTLDSAAQIIKESNSFLIILPPDPSLDIVAAGLGLFFSLSSSEKPVQIGCSGPIKLENHNLNGLDKIQDTVGDQNLQITFDFKEEDLEKVDYDVTPEGKFTLFIKPKPHCQPPDTSTIKYSYSGASADLVFVLGISSLSELGKLYADEKNFLDSAKIISLQSGMVPSNFASTSLHSPATLSEITTSLIKSAKLHLPSDGANNLLLSITRNTNQLSSKVTADTFEAVAHLMRCGASFQPGYTTPPVPTFESGNVNRPFVYRKPKVFKLHQNTPPPPSSQSSVNRN